MLEERYTYNAEKSENMIIRGDNLEALKALLPKFEGKVKCIYIDPPYNTGNEGWVYNDNVSDPKIKKWLGEVVGKEGEDLSRHDKWLCMMYPRLKLLQKLLADDGVIFISIDDTEYANLKLICDEIFGANCFVSNISWQRTSILASLKVDSLRRYREEGLIIVDNLETLAPEERQKVKVFVETQTPSEMQFILTSRNSEEYESNYKLAGFDAEVGFQFIKEYAEENALDITLPDTDTETLLSLARGNTLVLVLSLRRLSENLSTVGTLKAEFSTSNAWKSLRSTLSKTPSNAFEVVGEFMYKDTFEHIEATFATNAELFYKILKVFAVIQNDSTDINTICLLTGESYPDVEAVIDVLCSFLILEKKDMQYTLNGFAEKYIVGRFIPDAETYNLLSTEITTRQRQVKSALDQLQTDMEERTSLASIMRDWSIITDVDRITAAKMYRLYGAVRETCDRSGRFKVEAAFEDFLKECDEAERVTAHPFVKYQKARILQVIDKSNALREKHVAEIKKGFGDAIYAIKTIEQYANIQQTKSYASLLWLYGQYLSDVNDLQNAMRYLEEGKASFEDQSIRGQEYFQCATKLGTLYLNYYLQDRSTRATYLRKSRCGAG